MAGKTKARVGSPPAVRRWATPVAAAIILAVGAVIYSNSFSGAFVFDDRAAILEKAALWRNASLWEILSGHGQTPVVAVTLALNYRLGGDDPFGYHLVNLAVHLLAGLTLFGIVRRTLRIQASGFRLQASGVGAVAVPEARSPKPEAVSVPGGRNPQSEIRSMLLALVVALLWLAHPLQTESVTYIIQRKESLMGLFYLLTLYCVIRGHSSRRRAGWLAGAVAACALGMGTKQVMVTAPLMLLLYERTFLSGTFRKALSRSWALYLLLASTWCLLGASMQRLQQEGLGAAGGRLSTLDYAKTQFGVILHYLRLAFWPDQLCLDYGWWVPDTLAGILLPGAVVLVLAAASATLLFWRWREVGFLGAWFFVILAPTSSLVVITALAFEHRLYLSLAAVAALVVVGGYAAGAHVLERLSVAVSARRGAAWGAGALAVVVLCLLGYRTWLRNRDYRSELVMWQDVVRQRPGYAAARNRLGDSLLRAGNAAEAIAQYTESARLMDFSGTYNKRGLAYIKWGQYERALEDFNRAVERSPDFADALNNRGFCNGLLGRHDQAIADCARAIQLNPQSAESHFNRGTAYASKGRFDEALADYDRALALQADYVDAYCNRALAHMGKGQDQQAVEDCSRALRLDPGCGRAYLSRAIANYRLKAYARARLDLEAARRLGARPPSGFVEELERASSGAR